MHQWILIAQLFSSNLCFGSVEVVCVVEDLAMQIMGFDGVVVD
jgi:hypothetical protein